MNTLIIYDNEGYIISQITGNYRIPVGLPYLEVTIPERKILNSVDVSVTPHQAIFDDVPPSEVEQLRIEIAQVSAELFEMVLSGGNF